jgi:hypothetical protein
MIINIDNINKTNDVVHDVVSIEASEDGNYLYLYVEGRKLIYRLSKIHRIAIMGNSEDGSTT